MSEIAQAFVRIRPNMAGFRAETQSGVKSTFASIAKLAGVGLGAAEAVKFTKGLVEGAASVQKSTEVIKSGFGGASAAVLDFNQKTGAALGISAQQGEATAAKFSILFHNLGIGKGQAADMTVGLEKLAGSLSAIRGVDPTQSMQSLSMAMLGNMRSLKQLGLAFSPAQIAQEAFRLGIVKTTAATTTNNDLVVKASIAKARLAQAEQKYGAGTTQVAQAQLAYNAAQAKATAGVKGHVAALDPAQKAQAIYALATQHLGDFQKQAAAHSGDLSNVQRRLTADWTNAKDTIGTALLPAFTSLVDKLDKWLNRMMQSGQLQRDLNAALGLAKGLIVDVSDAVRTGWQIFETAAGWVGGVKNAVEALLAAVAIGKVMGVANGIVDNLVKRGILMIGPAAATAEAETTASFVGIGISSEALATTMKAALISTGLGAIAVAAGIAAMEIIQNWGTLKKWFSDLADWFDKHWRPIVVAVFGAFGILAVEVIDHWGAIKTWFVKFASDFALLFTHPIAAVEKMFDDLRDAVIGIFKAIVGTIGDLLSKIPTNILGIHIPGASELHDWGNALKQWSAGGTTLGTNLANSAATAITNSPAIKDAMQTVTNILSVSGPGGSSGYTNQGIPVGGNYGKKMSTQDIYKLLIGAGFSPNDASNFVGIAGAESGGNYGALNNNPSTGDYSVGLFQENFFKALGPSRTARYAPQFGLSPHLTPEAFVAWLQQHPAAQARIAADLFNSSGYAPWAGDAFIKAHPELLTGGTTTTTPTPTPTSTSDLTVGTTAPKFSAQTKATLETAYKAITAHAKELGTSLTSQIKAQMAEARAAIADVSNASTAAKARANLKALGATVSTALKDLKTELSLEKMFDGLKAAAAKLGTDVSPKIKSEMKGIQAEIGKATTPQTLAALHKQMADVKAEIVTQLAEVRARIALTKTFDGLTQQAAKLHDDITPVLQAEMKDIQDRIATAATPSSIARLKSDMARVKSEIAAQLAAIKASISADKTSFAGAFTELMTGADSAFDRATQAAVKNMQITVTGAFSAFTFGGSVAQTPAEIALQDLQDAHDAAAAQAKLTADQAQQAADDAAGNKDAVVQDAQAVADDLYAMRVTALQKQAQVERAAATQQLGDAQTAYQGQRDLLKQQMDQRTSLIEKGMEDGTIAAADGLAQLTGVFDDPKYGLDLQNSGLIIGGNLYTGLSLGLQPVFDLLTKLQNEMKKAGIPVGASAPAGPTTPGAGSVSPLLGPGSPGDRDAAAAAAAARTTAATAALILAELHKQTAIAREQAENGTVVVVGNDANASVAGARR